MGERDVNFLQLVFEHISDDVFLINKSGIILFSNIDHFSERSIFDLIVKQHEKRMKEAIQYSFQTKNSINLEIKAKIKITNQIGFL